MSLFSLRALATVAMLAAAVAAAPARAQQSAAPAVQDYAVFVDLPSAFAFIKLPSGWKFIGKLDADQLRHLPPGTLTALLPAEDDAPKLASEITKPRALQ
jgi:hypothetical protein